uniref:Uncharacterized protein n=1 Tax=Trichobilharzia regenti TaxID=157069 RepID=A0AA85KM14_TRIRE|nr:unnamed protein product [Trichobilharzia regenti]
MKRSDDMDRNWLFYLAQPTKLAVDIEELTITHKLELLKQALSQAEISERKTNLGNSENGSSDNFSTENEAIHPDDVFTESSKLFKKSKVLDIMSLQIAANLKFSLNLFRVVSEMPTKLYARLYRLLVTYTAKFSQILQPQFEQAINKENIFIINPYGYFTWSQLNPVTIYGIMSYHIWCLHVSLTSSMLPQPFRNLTPIVSGLTEIPEVTFFADNRVEVGVILTRIQESVNQLSEINDLLEDINIARPLSSVFSTTESIFSVFSELSSNPEDQNSNLSDFVLQNSEPLSKSYLSASLNFVLGRYAFQQQEFHRSQELFQKTLNEMQLQNFTYLNETGATPRLVQAYLTACLSYTPADHISDDNASIPQSDDEFLQYFCSELEKCSSSLEVNKNQVMNVFWTQIWNSIDSVQSESSSDKHLLTIEDHLYEILLKGLIPVNDDSSNSYIPISLGIRHKLENLCLKLLNAYNNLLMNSTDTTNTGVAQSTKQTKQAKSSLDDKISDFIAVHQLFTKIYVCNSIERLMSNSVEHPLMLVTELLINFDKELTKNQTDKSTSSSSSVFHIDAIKGREFLFDCLATIMQRLSSSLKNYSTSNQFLIICQYITFLVQEGICSLGSLSMMNKLHYHKQNSYLLTVQKNFQDLLETLVSHKLWTHLPVQNRKYIQSISEAISSANSFSNDSDSEYSCSFNHKSLTDLPDPDYDLDFNLFNLDGGEDLLTQGPGFRLNHEISSPKDQISGPFKSSHMPKGNSPFQSVGDVDMRNLPQQIPSFSHMPVVQPHLIPGHGSFTSSSLPTLSKDNPHAYKIHVVRHLLLTRNPTDVNMLVDNLLRLGVTPDGILKINDSWLSSLHLLLSLEVVGLHGISGNNETNPIAFLLSSSGNIMWAVTVLLQLAKGSAIIRHEAGTLEYTTARAMLLASLNNLASVNPIVPPPASLSTSLPVNVATASHTVGKQSRIGDIFQWIRAAIKHELMLLDLLEFLNPSSFISIEENNQSYGVSKPNHSGQVSLNELIRRAKIILCYAAGLPSHANSLENKMESLNLIGLSDELITAATCFLLMVKEYDFLYPTSTPMQTISLPSENISYCVTCTASLHLIRILLHFHEVLQSTENVNKKMNINSEKQTSSSSLSTSPVFKNLLSATVKYGDLEKLKIVINEFYELILMRGCLFVEYSNSTDNVMNSNSKVSGSEQQQQQQQNNRNNYHSDTSRLRITSPSLYNIIGLLATIDKVAQLIIATGLNFPMNAKLKNSTDSEHVFIGLQLLDYLIIGFAQIAHQVCTKFSLRILKQVVSCFSMNNTFDEYKTTIESSITNSEDNGTTACTNNSSSDLQSNTTKMRTSRWDKPLTEPAKKDRRRNQQHEKNLTDHHQKGVILSFLDQQLWTLNLESHSLSYQDTDMTRLS